VFVKNCVRSSKLKKGSVTRNKLFVPINRSLYVSYHNGNKPLLKQVLSVTKHREYPIGLGASTITIDSLSIPPYSCLTLPYFNKDQPVHCDNFRLALSAEVSQAEWQSFQSTSQFSEAIWQYGEGDIGSVSILTRPFPEGTEGRSCYAGRYLDITLYTYPHVRFAPNFYAEKEFDHFQVNSTQTTSGSSHSSSYSLTQAQKHPCATN